MLITKKEKLKKFHAENRIWQGIPGIEKTKGGKIFITFYSGNVREDFGNYCVVTKSDNEKDFSEPIAVAFLEGDNRCYDPCLWIDPLGRLWFIWNTHPDEEVRASICENPDADELVWSEDFLIGKGIMLNKPTVLSTGEWLFPIAVWKNGLMYDEKFFSKRDENTVIGSFVYRTCDYGKTFQKLGFADINDRSFDEHMVLEHENGTLLMLVRTNYGIGAAYSYDKGETWSEGFDSKLGGPNARFFIGRLKSGRILLINHHNYTGRNNLTAFLSDDDGKTFPHTLLLDERDQVSYPDVTEDQNGNIYIVYDRERGSFKKSLEEINACAREVIFAKITEEDILNGKLVSKDSYLKRIADKLYKIPELDQNPFELLK